MMVLKMDGDDSNLNYCWMACPPTDRKYEKNTRFERKDKEFHFGHVEFIVPLKTSNEYKEKQNKAPVF